MSDLEDRIARIEDDLAITQLIASYGVLLDNRDYEALGDLFTEEARFHSRDDSIDVRTRRGIVEFYRERLAGTGPTFHYPHSHILELGSGPSATGIVTAHAEMGLQGRMVLTGCRYYDRYRKGDDGRWRFSDREAWFHYSMPVEELPSSYEKAIRRTWPGPELPADLPEMLPTYQASKSR